MEEGLPRAHRTATPRQIYDAWAGSGNPRIHNVDKKLDFALDSSLFPYGQVAILNEVQSGSADVATAPGDKLELKYLRVRAYTRLNDVDVGQLPTNVSCLVVRVIIGWCTTSSSNPASEILDTSNGLLMGYTDWDPMAFNQRVDADRNVWYLKKFFVLRDEMKSGSSGVYYTAVPMYNPNVAPPTTPVVRQDQATYSLSSDILFDFDIDLSGLPQKNFFGAGSPNERTGVLFAFVHCDSPPGTGGKAIYRLVGQTRCYYEAFE